MTHVQTPSFNARSKRLRRLLATSPLWAGLLGAGHAQAQADVDPPPPNILLLVDTSGSMDYKTGSDTFPTCHYSGSATTAQTSERSRWIDLVEVMTGSINNYECQRLDRNSPLFRSEYALGAAQPYDALYANPYHRPASKNCVAGPGTLDPSNAALFPSSAIKYHPFDNTASTCTYEQGSDGVLDSFYGDVRFGLMTFDTEPRAGKDMSGLWSYYLNSPRTGRPAGCDKDQEQEVGVRNAEAPPWEGRMVGFGNPVLNLADVKERNSMIQKVLLATRPYGATPIAGMLADARTYLTADASDDPLDPTFKFGPMSDPAKGCRKKAIILLSDGQPNMDLRPYCEPNGCPYDKAEDIAQNLKELGYYIYVIGFALPSITVNGTPQSCSDLKATDAACTQPTDPALQACCALNRIAAAGGPPPPPSPKAGETAEADWSHAHFAGDRATLATELSQAISANLNTTTRTPFVGASGSGFVPPTSDRVFARAFRFGAGIKPGRLDQLWRGELNRSRYVCEKDGASGPLKPVLKEPEASEGDRFADNLAVDPRKRQIYTVIGRSPANSDASLRPNLTSAVTDGVGTYSGTVLTGAPSDIVSGTPAEALKVTEKTCEGLTAADCRSRIMKWLFGLDGDARFHRCREAGKADCQLMADIFHSIPKVVPGRPSAFLIDQSYQRFVSDQIKAKRPPVIYASSNDGFLHAFKIAQVDKNDTTESMKVRTKESNELWAFIPPGALTGVPTIYPARHQLLLDGTPSIKDVVATADGAQPNYKFRLERTLEQARAGAGTWRTILVQSYGTQRPGYFALDVTDPVAGPQFLWQLTTDSAGKQLFGSGGGTPLVTSAYLNGKEVAVAILPGGYGGPGNAGASKGGCPRAETSFTDLTVNGIPEPRAFVRCYDEESAVRARSLTVVRLDSGEIIRTFRRDASEVPGVSNTLVTASKIDSPMTGQPVAYPADVGAVADRVFIGDQDGTLWRLNLASSGGDPQDWTLELFFDGFPKTSPQFGHDFDDGQPITAAPLISVDRVGNLTVAFSTGDQEAREGSTAMSNYVWSLTERPSADRKKLAPVVNWNLGLKGALGGDRVIGELAIFNGDLFFSTVGPPTAGDACSTVNGKVWGMHYLDKHADGDGKGGVLARSFKDLVGTGGYIDATTLLGTDTRGFLSGVSVGQQPTCEDLDEGADSGFFSNGSVLKGTPQSGAYQLFVPTGDKASTSTKSGITPINSGGVKGVAISLPTPPASLIVDSWAAIVE